MKTIEELFVAEYEKQTKTIENLYQVINSLNVRIEELKGDIKALKEHHQATLDEVKRIGLTFHLAGYITAYCTFYGKETKDEFPILAESGCVNPVVENNDGTK